MSAPSGDQTQHPGMYPEQESNWRPFPLWDDGQPAEPHQSGQSHISLKNAAYCIILMGNAKDTSILEAEEFCQTLSSTSQIHFDHE